MPQGSVDRAAAPAPLSLLPRPAYHLPALPSEPRVSGTCAEPRPGRLFPSAPRRAALAPSSAGAGAARSLEDPLPPEDAGGQAPWVAAARANSFCSRPTLAKRGAHKLRFELRVPGREQSSGGGGGLKNARPPPPPQPFAVSRLQAPRAPRPRPLGTEIQTPLERVRRVQRHTRGGEEESGCVSPQINPSVLQSVNPETNLPSSGSDPPSSKTHWALFTKDCGLGAPGSGPGLSWARPREPRACAPAGRAVRLGGPPPPPPARRARSPAGRSSRTDSGGSRPGSSGETRPGTRASRRCFPGCWGAPPAPAGAPSRTQAASAAASGAARGHGRCPPRPPPALPPPSPRPSSGAARRPCSASASATRGPALPPWGIREQGMKRALH